MTMRRNNFSDLMAPAMRAIFFEKFGEKPPQYTQIFNMLTTRRQYEDDSYIAGFGLVPKKSEGASVAYDDAIQGYDKRYTPETRSMAYRITLEMMEDELYRKIQKLPAALARSLRATIETDGANVFNNGFNSAYTGGDGVELFSLVHPLVGGGTQKNELTTAADLTAASLEQAMLDIRATTDDRGILLNLLPRKLFVAPAGEWDAKVLLNTGQVIGSGNNDLNVASTLNLELVVLDYLTDTDAWFIGADEHEVNWFWRTLPDHYQGNDFDTDDAKFKIRARWACGWSLPWGMFGTPGA